MQLKILYFETVLIRNHIKLTKHLGFANGCGRVLNVIPGLLDHIGPLLWPRFPQAKRWFWQ